MRVKRLAIVATHPQNISMIRKTLSKSVALVPWRLRTKIKRIPLIGLVQRLLLAKFVEVHSRALAQECFNFLSSLGYQTITVLETGRPPNFLSEPEVCHIVARLHSKK